MKLIFKAAAAALLCLMLSSCRAGGQLPPPTLIPTLEATAPVVVPSATPLPTATALPGRLVLVAAGQGAQNADLEKFLAAQAEKAGLLLDKRDALQPADLGPAVRVVIALTQPANLADLQAAAPQAQFLVVSEGGLEPGAQLSVVLVQPEQQAFVAGYTAAMLSDDWRAAGLIANDRPQMQEAFRNGEGYFCGECALGWPQNVKFPLVSDIPSASDGAAWAASAQDLFDNGKAEVFYLSADAYKDEVYAALAGKVQVNTAVKVFGSGASPQALKAQWAATVAVDPLEAIQEALPELLAGRSAGALAAPVQLINVNPALLSAGRLDLIQTVIADLASGKLSPASVP